MPTEIMSISSRRAKQVIDITDRVEKVVDSARVADGLCNVFVCHTTAGITTGESIEGTDEDLMETLEKIIPNIKFRHAHDPGHAPDHMISSIIGANVSIPITRGKLHLGTWQRVLLVECKGPRERECVVTVIPA